MALTNSFKFLKDARNNRFIAALKKAGIRHTVDNRGIVRYSPDDEDVVEDNIISSIRGSVFSSWQILCCPKSWVQAYRDYMTARGIPFAEELIDNETCFLIHRRYRPHSWKLKAPKRRSPFVSAARA